MNNIQNSDFEFPADIFNDPGNSDLDVMDVQDYNNDLLFALDVVISVLNDTVNEPAINIISNMDEEVPLLKKPRLHFHYENIES